jgi:hypothetical protein
MANGSADSTARLENWFWTQPPPLFSGKIFDDPPPRSWPDGASTRTSIVSELEQRGAAEGKIIVTLTGPGDTCLARRRRMRRSRRARRCAARGRCWRRSRRPETKKSPRAGLTRNKRPRGRAPAGYGWDEQTGVTGSTRMGSRSSSSTTRADNGSELRSARLRWRAALSSGRLTVCSKKKNSDGNGCAPRSPIGHARGSALARSAFPSRIKDGETGETRAGTGMRTRCR